MELIKKIRTRLSEWRGRAHERSKQNQANRISDTFKIKVKNGRMFITHYDDAVKELDPTLSVSNAIGIIEGMRNTATDYELGCKTK